MVLPTSNAFPKENPTGQNKGIAAEKVMGVLALSNTPIIISFGALLFP